MAITFPAMCDRPARTLFEGAVLTTRERNGYHDSDFYAVVWDEERKELREVEYDTTRFAGGGNAVVDATDEVKTKASKWLRAWAFRALKAKEIRASMQVEEGRRVRVVSGRKVEHGTAGEVFYTQTCTYGYNTKATKIGIALTKRMKKVKKKGYDGKVRTFKNYADTAWTYAKNVEVIDPEQYQRSDSTLRRLAKRYETAWHLPFVMNGHVAL